MSEKVRLVIWDLDETFWKGTVTEGGITYSQQNHDIVVELARRGIVSSICSKNDIEPIKRLLEERGLWSYFVFPSVNWEPKGPRLATMIENIGLRAPTVLFIDDNPMNLNEAKHFVPDLQVAGPEAIAGLLDNPLLQGKDDSGLTRLQQYKLLEQRHADQEKSEAQGTSNYDFLRGSGIRVRIEVDVEKHIDRAVELINRTNQLNFTKERLPENLTAAREELRKQLGQYDVQAGLVSVKDNYGDYGFVGFYLLKSIGGRRNLVHFCFSCRTLGMGIETWVWRIIGRPWLPFVGEVVSDPRDESLPCDWIADVTATGESGGDSQGIMDIQRLVLRGGCNGLSMTHYFHSRAREVIDEVPIARDGLQIRLDHTLFLINGMDCIDAAALNEVAKLGIRPDDFKTKLFDEAIENPIVIFDFWTDSEIAVYRHSKLGFRIPFVAPYHFPVKPDGDARALPTNYSDSAFPQGHFVFRAIEELRANYEYEGLIGEEFFKDNLRRILTALPRAAQVFLLLANESWLNPGNGLTYRYERHAHLNSWMREVAASFRSVQFIDPRAHFASEADAHTVNHFDRMVYFRMYQTICDLIERHKPSAGQPVELADIGEDASVTKGNPNRDSSTIYELGGIKVAVPKSGYGDVITESIVRGGYEAVERTTVPKMLKPGDRVLEVGGAIGVVSMAAAKVVGAENVMSFEANRELVEHAVRNFEINGLQVNARCGILQNKIDWVGPRRRVPFYIHKDFWASSLSDKPGTISTVDVESYCLESEAQAFRANVLICDIEGGEIDLLTHADLSCFDKILMEVHHWAGREAINRLIRKLVFDGFSIDLELTGNATVVLHRGLSRPS